MSLELEECKAQLQAVVATVKESDKASSVNTCFHCKECKYVYQLVSSMLTNLTIDSADNPGMNPEIIHEDEPQAQR